MNVALIWDNGHVTTPRNVSETEERLRQAEEIIRAQNRKMQAMYDNDLSALWPRDADELQGAYEKQYGVDLDGEQP